MELPPPPHMEEEYDTVEDEDLIMLEQYADSMDSFPLELTRGLGDLRELDSVLSSSLIHLTNRIRSLTTAVLDKSVSPEERLMLLQSVAQDAAQFKKGGQEKVSAVKDICKNTASQQQHMGDLLRSATNLFIPVTPPPPKPKQLPKTKELQEATKPTRIMARQTTSRQQQQPAQIAPREASHQPLPEPEKREIRATRSVAASTSTEPQHNHAAAAGPSSSTRPSRFTKEVPAIAPPPPASKPTSRKRRQRTDSDDDDIFLVAPSPSKQAAATAAPPTATRTSTRVRRTSTTQQPNMVPLGSSTESEPSSRESSVFSDPAPLIDPHPTVLTPLKPAPSHQSFIDIVFDGAGAVIAGNSAPDVAVDQHGGKDEDVDMDEIETSMEKSYCICGTGEDGRMIACDDDQCRVEWYHLECLDLPAPPPKGKWICDDCLQRRAYSYHEQGTPDLPLPHDFSEWTDTERERYYLEKRHRPGYSAHRALEDYQRAEREFYESDEVGERAARRRIKMEDVLNSNTNSDAGSSRAPGTTVYGTAEMSSDLSQRRGSSGGIKVWEEPPR